MISGLTIAENAYLPLRDVVFQTLRQAILKGELQPGERLMEIKLAETLGVSRTPIREAIRKLELEGLVVMIPRKGAAVANITEKDTKDVLEVRRTLEMFAVEVACDRITEEQLVLTCGNLLSGDSEAAQVSLGVNGGNKYDIVVANILADVIIPLSGVVKPFLKDEGYFITSGIIDMKEEAVKEALLENGFNIIDIVHMNDWVSIIAKIA